MVIAMSASEDPDMLGRCLSSGCEDYIVKPVRLHELKLRIAKVMHSEERAETSRNKYIEQNTHSMSHGYGTPLMTLKLAAEMLQAEMKVGNMISDTHEELLQKVVGSTECLSAVCHNALDLHVPQWEADSESPRILT